MSIREDLINMSEPAYKEFSSKLMPAVDKETVLGVRTPKLILLLIHLLSKRCNVI